MLVQLFNGSILESGKILDQPCITVGGEKEGLPCIFPFTYEGVVHNECTDKGGSSLWCSTKVDDSGKHIQGNFGNCGEGCLDNTGNI